MTAQPAGTTVLRSFGSNVVLALENEHQVVLVGRGIGFGARVGSVVDLTAVEQRFVPDSTHRADAIADLVQDAPIEQVALAREIAELAATQLGVDPRPGFVLAVLDHLLYAVQRAQDGTTIDHPLKYEVAQWYPAEAQFGRSSVALVLKRLAVQLQEEEWVAFALHGVNQQWRKQDIGRTMAMTETIHRIFTELESQWNFAVSQDSRDAARFVTHLRYLFSRVVEDNQEARTQLELLGTVARAYPGVVTAARGAAAYIEAFLKRSLTEPEVAYIALHLGRLYEATALGR